MTEKIPEDALIACEICRKEVPLSEAKVPEATDYVAHFCGLECYAVWQKDSASADEKASDEPGKDPK